MKSLAVTVDAGAFDFRRSLVLQRFGRHDPSATLDEHGFSKRFSWRGQRVRVQIDRGDTPGSLRLHGPQALIEPWSRRFPPADGYAGFAPNHHGLMRLHQRFRGLRIVAVPWLYDWACSCVLQQRVRLPDATASWRRIVERFGTDGVFPSPKQLARLTPPELRSCGVDFQRAKTLGSLARRHAIDGLLDDRPTPEVLRDWLRALPGVGPWTTEMVLLFGAGDPDAVPLGDWHLSHVISMFFRGRPRGSDEQMLELLEPFAGQRGRVARLVTAHTPKRPRRA